MHISGWEPSSVGSASVTHYYMMKQTNVYVSDGNLLKARNQFKNLLSQSQEIQRKYIYKYTYKIYILSWNQNGYMSIYIWGQHLFQECISLYYFYIHLLLSIVAESNTKQRYMTSVWRLCTKNKRKMVHQNVTVLYISLSVTQRLNHAANQGCYSNLCFDNFNDKFTDGQHVLTQKSQNSRFYRGLTL